MKGPRQRHVRSTALHAAHRHAEPGTLRGVSDSLGDNNPLNIRCTNQGMVIIEPTAPLELPPPKMPPLGKVNAEFAGIQRSGQGSRRTGMPD